MDIVDDVLDLSKIESGEFRIKHEIFSLEECVHTVRDIFVEKAKEKDLRFVIGVGSTVPTNFIGDSQRIKQVLINLCSNAIKFTETGGVTVTIDWSSKNRSSCRLKIIVKDTGIGISEEQILKYFLLFSSLIAAKPANMVELGSDCLSVKKSFT